MQNSTYSNNLPYLFAADCFGILVPLKLLLMVTDKDHSVIVIMYLMSM